LYSVIRIPCTIDEPIAKYFLPQAR
jgi:hypothetical protein